MDDVNKEAKSYLDKIFGDVSKTSPMKQLVIGTGAGLFTGFLAMRVGKISALALGGGIILVQIANEQGYIKINWDKIDKKLDKVADKVEERITGEGPGWMDKMGRNLDKKLDKLSNKANKALGKEPETWGYKIQRFALQNTPFSAGFVGGFLIGMSCTPKKM